MKKLSLYVFLVLMFSFTINAYSWEKVPVPDYVDKKTQSPWNFYENFEDQELGKPKLKGLNINNKGTGWKPFKIEQENNGNKYIAITVKDGWNKCCGSWIKTERAEIETSKKKSKNKEIWYGFRVKFPKNFIHIDDRLLFNQFKNQFDPMKGSPLLGMRYYSNGKLLNFGGQTGGAASKSWSKKQKFKHFYLFQYKNRSGILILLRQKNLGEEEFSCTKIWTSASGKITTPAMCLNGGNKVQESILGEWTTYSVGIKNSKEKNGFVKVFKNNKLVVDYNGVTFNWKGNYKGSLVRIGPYRDSDPSGKGYPDQTIYYDDLIVVSDKKTLDKYLDK